jgi:putative membrane protein
MTSLGGRGGPATGGTPARSWQDYSMHVLIRAVLTAAALAVATAIVPGIQLTSGSTAAKVGTLLAVAVIFGVVNAVIKPVVKIVGCLFYVLTLGLIALVVNGLLLWLTSWVAGQLSLPFHITGFWAAFWGAIIVSVVGWLLGVLVPDRRDEPED